MASQFPMDTSAFLGTNPADELITSGLPVIRPLSVDLTLVYRGVLECIGLFASLQNRSWRSGRFSLSVGASTPVWTFGTCSQLSGFIFQPEDRGSCHYNNEFPKEHGRSGQSPRSRP